jgi:hypothetical protein
MFCVGPLVLGLPAMPLGPYHPRADSRNSSSSITIAARSASVAASAWVIIRGRVSSTLTVPSQ